MASKITNVVAPTPRPEDDRLIAPKAALCFSVADVEVDDNGANAKTAPVRMIARSGDPITHWYWGRVVHDLAGMTPNKPKLPIDYCHEDDEVLGYLNKFDTSSGDLVVSGALTPFAADDRASEVIFKAKAGVPYEASINFAGGDLQVEYIGDGEVTQVNGRTFAGPGYVVRKWTLRGVAICPYGADPDTATEFKESESVTIFLSKGERTMSLTTNKPAEGAATPPTKVAPPVDASKLNAAEGAKPVEVAPEGKPAETAPAAATATPTPEATQLASKPSDASGAAGAAATPVVEAKPGAEYVAAFGDTGARWFLEGKTFPDCAAKFIADLRESHKRDLDAKVAEFGKEKTALEAEITGLKSRIAGVERGAPGVAFSNADKQTPPGGSADARVAHLTRVLGENLGRVAAGMKLPGRK